MYTFLGILILIVISTSNAQYQYKSINPQRYFNYNVNPYISAQVKAENSNFEGNISLTFHENVYKKDNFKVSVKYVNDRGTTISHVVKVTNLCDQLDSELQGDQFLKLGDILGLSGIQCPILVSDTNEKFEAKPMKWYSKHNFSEKIECGNYSYHATLYKCNSDGNDCIILLESGIKFLLISEHCEENKETGERPSLPIDLSSDIQVSQVSKTRLTGANAKNVEVIDKFLNNKTVGIINTADLSDQQINKFNILDKKTNQSYDIFNSQVNNVHVVNTKVTNYHQHNLNNFNDDDNDDENNNKIQNSGPSQIRVTRVKTKGSSSMTHFEKMKDQIGDSEILESKKERDQTVDSESDNVTIETYNGNQSKKFSSNLGSIIIGNKIKSNIILHSLYASKS